MKKNSETFTDSLPAEPSRGRGGRWLTVWVNICRTVLALVFLFSGFAKAIDPIGMGYKIEAYLRSFGWTYFLQEPFPLVLAVVVASVEFLLGIYLLLGARRRLVAWVMLVLMSVLTVLTAYIYWKNPVKDCGCFGDVLILTNGQTFAKNIVLWVLAASVAARPERIGRLVSEHNQWIVCIYSAVYILVVCVMSTYYLPLIDFGHFKVGTNLPEAMKGKTEMRFLYHKGAVTREFSMDSIPTDTTWQYVNTKTIVLKEAEIPYFSVSRGEEDLTEAFLAQTGYVFVLVSPNLDLAEEGVADRLNNLSDYCQDKGYTLCCLTASNKAAVERWKDRTGATYPFYEADEEMLKEMVRSNPGMLLMKDGTVLHKWSSNDLPDESFTGKPLPGNAALIKAETSTTRRQLMNLIIWFVVPLLLTIFLDALYEAWRRKKKTHNSQINSKTKMRKKIVAGNWKMNKNLQEGIALAKELNEVLTADKPNCGVVICTPFIHLASVAPIIDKTIIGLGAENCADKVSGAYTGEVSAEMVKSTGADYVILGHSERRAYYHETAEILKEKVNLALANNLKVIFCIGEVLADREAGKQNEVVKAQLEGSLYDLTTEQFSNIVLAYEPVWAIGTGKTATSDQAQDMHAFIRSTIAAKFGAEAAENVSILYGGSCKPGNAKELFSKPDVDGGLIGGAALKAADFKGIIDAWKK